MTRALRTKTKKLFADALFHAAGELCNALGEERELVLGPHRSDLLLSCSAVADSLLLRLQGSGCSGRLVVNLDNLSLESGDESLYSLGSLSNSGLQLTDEELKLGGTSAAANVLDLVNLERGRLEAERERKRKRERTRSTVSGGNANTAPFTQTTCEKSKRK